MSRRKLFNRNTRKLARVGGGKTYSVTIPIDMIRQLNWKEKQKVVFVFNKRKQELVIKDWKKKTSAANKS